MSRSRWSLASSVRAWLDADGVALAAIQGLNRKLEAKAAEIAELELRLEKLERLLGTRGGGVR